MQTDDAQTIDWCLADDRLHRGFPRLEYLVFEPAGRQSFGPRLWRGAARRGRAFVLAVPGPGPARCERLRHIPLSCPASDASKMRREGRESRWSQRDGLEAWIPFPLIAR